MSPDSIVCESCAESGSGEVTVTEKDPPGQLILMCDHQTSIFSLDEYDAETLPPESALPGIWSTGAADG